MIRSILSILLAAFFLLQPAISARAAAAQSAQEEARAAAIRKQVEAAGVGAKVEIRLLDNNRIQGLLTSVGSKDFTVLAGSAQAPVMQTIRFQDVKSFKATGAPPASTPTPAPVARAPRPRSPIATRAFLMLAIGISALVIGIATYIHTK